MATEDKSDVDAQAARARDSAQQEEEVYGMLGALLGTLEVVATDDAYPLASVQAERLKTAVRLCYRFQHQAEALLAMALDDLTLRRHYVAVRPLLEHALRGAVRSFEARNIELRMPQGDDWGSERVYIDPSRVDRMLKALAEALAGSLGQGGAIDVVLRVEASRVELALTGHPGTKLTKKQAMFESTLSGSLLLREGAARLFARLGGEVAFDLERFVVRVCLPTSETPHANTKRARE